MKNRQWKNSIVSALVVGMVCTVMAGSAMATECRLDWNGDLQIDESDYLVGDPMGGYYAEWYIYVYYPSYYPILFPGFDPARLDYDGDGDVDQDDLMGPLDEAAATEGYYVEWYIFVFYPGYYPIFFPEYDVCPPTPVGGCPALDYIDVGGPDDLGEPKFLTPLDGKLYFSAFMPGFGTELQVYDPATGVVSNAADIAPGIISSHPWDIFVHLGKLYFRASGVDWDDELYVYDPAVPGTATKIDVNPTSFSMPRHFMSGSDGKLYFQGRTSSDGAELHTYDPATGDLHYWDFWTGTDQYGQPHAFQPRNLLEHDGKIYMSGVGTEGRELYEFDMATEQVTRLSNIATGYGPSGNGMSSYPQFLYIFNNQLFFTATDDGAVNHELWIYDPATGGLREKVIEPGMGILQGALAPAGSFPSQFIEYGGKLYFRAQKVAVGTELFVYDPATDLVPLAFDSYPGQYEFCQGPCMTYGNDGYTNELTLRGDKIYYVATFDNKELWEFDPATGVGSQMYEIFPGDNQWGAPAHGEPTSMVEMDGDLYFQASNASADSELFMVTWASENCS